MINLTLAALSLTNIFSYSPMFSTLRSQATFNFLNVQNSFSTSILSEQSLNVYKSKFTNFLSSSITLKSSHKVPKEEFSNSYRGSRVRLSIFQRCLATNSNSNCGGGIYCIYSYNCEIDSCLFVYCEASKSGGAIYANVGDSANSSIRYTRTFSCLAQEGSPFYINTGQAIFSQNSFEESSPSRRPGLESSGIILGRINDISKVNFTSCYSVRSSVLRLDCSQSQEITYVTFHKNNGYNIWCLRGLGDKSSSLIQYNLMINNTLNGITSSIGNDPQEGNSLICIMGEWLMLDCHFFYNQGKVSSGGYGTLTFFRCYFDIADPSKNHSNVFFQECFFLSTPEYVNYGTFNVNNLVYNGPQCFKGETMNPMDQPTKPAFKMGSRITYVVVGIILTLLFAAVTIVSCWLVRRHRKHVLCILHSVYAEEGRSSDDEAAQKELESDNLIAVRDTKYDKKKKEIQNDFDDFYHKVRKDKRFQFDDIEVPDTHMWDTEGGEVEVPDEEPFMIDVNDILKNFNKGNNSPKKSSKNKKKKKG